MSIWSRNFKSRAVIILYLVPLLPYIIERGTHFVEVFFKLALTLVPLHCNPYGQQFQWVAKHLFSIYQPYMSELQAELRKSSHPTHTGNVLIFLWGLWSTTNRRQLSASFLLFSDWIGSAVFLLLLLFQEKFTTPYCMIHAAILQFLMTNFNVIATL